MRRRQERGIVLLLVMGAVAILAVLAIEVASRASVESMFAHRMAKNAAFRRLFDSGSAVAEGLLSEPEAKTYDWWGDAWNRDTRFGLGSQETAVLQVADESGKINIARVFTHPDERAKTKGMLKRLFEYLARESPAKAGYWMEREKRVLGRLGFTGPKSPEPLLTLDGLREAGLSREEVFGPQGLAKYLTAFSDGKINLNTAPRAVLYSLDPEMDAGVTDRIARFRGKLEGEPGTYRAFGSAKDLELVDGVVERTWVDGRPKLTRNLLEKVGNSVTTQSAFFSVRISADVSGRRREAWAFFAAPRLQRPGEPLRRDSRRIVLEEILP